MACGQCYESHDGMLSAAWLQVCEGLTKRFHAVAFKKDGKKLAVLKAGGCLGKSAIAIAPPMNKSRRGDDDALEWPAEMPEACAPCFLMRDLAQERHFWQQSCVPCRGNRHLHACSGVCRLQCTQLVHGLW